MRILKAFLLTVFLFPAVSLAQVEVVPAPDARPSPMRLSATTVGDTYMKIVYSAPEKRGRTIFGELVPFDQVWRTGANEATEILFTGDVVVAGTPVSAGMYSVFTIPGENEWTLILNRTLGQWGAFEHDPESDAYRIVVPSETVNRDHESFAISFEDPGSDDNADTVLTLNWERTAVRIPVTLP